MNPALTTAVSGELAGAVADVLVPLQLFTGQFLYYAVVLFILAIVAAALGLRGVAGVTMDIAKFLVVIFVVLAVVALLL